MKHSLVISMYGMKCTNRNHGSLLCVWGVKVSFSANLCCVNQTWHPSTKLWSVCALVKTLISCVFIPMFAETGAPQIMGPLCL